jgi:hypothetical protein
LGCNTTPLAPPLCTFITCSSTRRLGMQHDTPRPSSLHVHRMLFHASSRRLGMQHDAPRPSPLAPLSSLHVHRTPFHTSLHALPRVVAHPSTCRCTPFTCLARPSNIFDALSTHHCTPLHAPPHPSTCSCTLFDALLNALRRVIARPSTPFDARFRLRRTVSPFSITAAAAADALFARSLAALPASTHNLHVPPSRFRVKKPLWVLYSTSRRWPLWCTQPRSRPCPLLRPCLRRHPLCQANVNLGLCGYTMMSVSCKVPSPTALSTALSPDVFFSSPSPLPFRFSVLTRT